MRLLLLPPLAIVIATSLLTSAQGVARGFPWSPTSSCLSDTVRLGYLYTPPPGGDPPNVYRQTYPPVTLEYGAWVTANLTTYVAAILLSEVLNFRVQINEMPGLATTYTRVAAGNTTFNFEVWPNNRQLDYAKFIVGQQTVMDTGPLGYLGAVNWYFPVSLAQQYPDKIIESWRSLFDPTVLALFPPAGTTPPFQPTPGNYLCPMNNSPPCTNGAYIPPQCQPTGRFHGQCRELWHNFPNLNRGESEQIIHDLGLPLIVVYLGDSFYSHVADCVAARNASRSCLVYYWAPDTFHSTFPMDKVALPSYTSSSWSAFDVNVAGSAGTSLKCGWPREALHKIGNAGVLRSNAILREFAANVKVGDGDLNGMMGEVDPNNATTVAVAACKWIREHQEALWHAWIPKPPPGYLRYAPSSVAARPDQVIQLVLLITGTLIPLTILLLIHSNRRNTQIRVYSPLLLAMTNVGCILFVLGSSLPLLGISSASCSARPFVISLGLLIMQVALAARAWRLYAIINNKQYSIVLFGRLVALRGTNSQVMAVCGLALAFQSLVMLIARGLARIDSVPVREIPAGGPSDEFYWVCPPILPNLIQVLIAIPHAFLAIGSVYLARHARRVVSITADPKQVLQFYAYFSLGVGVTVVLSLTSISAYGMGRVAMGDMNIPMSLATQLATMHLTAPPFLSILVGKWRDWLARIQGYSDAKGGLEMQNVGDGDDEQDDNASRAVGMSRAAGGRGAITMALDADETQSMWQDLDNSNVTVPAAPKATLTANGAAGAGKAIINVHQGEDAGASMAGAATSSKLAVGANGTRPREHMTHNADGPGSLLALQSQERDEAMLRTLFLVHPHMAAAAHGHSHGPSSSAPQVHVLNVPVRYLTRPVGVRSLESWGEPWIEAHLLLVPTMGMFSILPAILPGLLKHNRKGWTYWQARGKKPSVAKNAKHPDRIFLIHNGSCRAFELQFASATAADRWSLTFSAMFAPPAAAASQNSMAKRVSASFSSSRRPLSSG